MIARTNILIKKQCYSFLAKYYSQLAKFDILRQAKQFYYYDKIMLLVILRYFLLCFTLITEACDILLLNFLTVLHLSFVTIAESWCAMRAVPNLIGHKTSNNNIVIEDVPITVKDTKDYFQKSRSAREYYNLKPILLLVVIPFYKLKLRFQLYCLYHHIFHQLS